MDQDDVMIEKWIDITCDFYDKHELSTDDILKLHRMTIESLIAEKANREKKGQNINEVKLIEDIPEEIRDEAMLWVSELPSFFPKSESILLQLRLEFFLEVDKSFSSWDEFFKYIIEMIYHEQESGEVAFIT